MRGNSLATIKERSEKLRRRFLGRKVRTCRGSPFEGSYQHCSTRRSCALPTRTSRAANPDSLTFGCRSTVYRLITSGQLPSVLRIADLDVFEATADAANMPPASVLEETMPAFEALCNQAHWGMQGVLFLSVTTSRARAAVHGRTDVVAEDFWWAIRTRAAAFEALTGRHIEFP
jgi:hypothetical protein